MCALLALTAPLAAMAQQTVFYDTFGTSSLNQTNISGGIPGGVPTASQTSYTIGSAKNALATSITPGRLRLQTGATSSGNSEAQAVFTRYPVKLESVGDYIEMTYTFTDNYPMMQPAASASTALFAGLFNSGGVAPQSGAQATILQNGGFSSATTACVGGVKQWVGFHAQMYNYTTAWRIYARPAQTAENNLNQVLLYNYPLAQGNGGSITPGSPDLIPGQQYTVQLRVTLSAASQLTVSNALYTGVGTSGTQFTNTSWVVTGANLVTTNFDSLAIGYRAGNPAAWTNDINSITVVAGLAAQAGPYFTLTSSGNGCGSAPIGLDGSVTTNVYMLYTNGVFNGNSILGTGGALDFGTQTEGAVYTIVASNIVTASVGPMWGSKSISVSVPVIASQPANVSCVTNAPASFTVAATGNTLTYQWYKNGIALANGGDFSGVTTTNLLVSPAQAADAATTANGYSVVVTDPCGNSVTSTPNASLTLLAPNNLVWQGGNPDTTWDAGITLNFAGPVAFAYGDNVTFNDASANTSVVLSNSLTPSLVTVSGTQAYSLAGPGSITGFGRLVDGSSGVLTITSTNTYTGGTVISNNATLSLGDGATAGYVAGVVTINANGALIYNYLRDASIANSLAGSGTVNYLSAQGGTLTLPLAGINSNFTGVANLTAGVRVHAQNGSSYPFGNGSIVNVSSYCQAWCDGTTYNNTFNIAGTGWPGTTPPTGAISVYQSIFTGAINLTDNARISGTIAGGTIVCPISGAYQLEIMGNPGSYVLSMGPTNGVHSYASTLITSGTIRALNTNAISTGPLTMDLGSDLRLNGCNLTVSNLSSIVSGQTTNTAPPTIQNIHATTAATLTVGADGSTTSFDGVFGNGGAAALGLTKVGTGTLTLSGISTNTGAVTVNGGILAVNGSFNNASRIIIGSGAAYDVTGAGGTLTLNSGQTLGGSGTNIGNVVASSGSTVAPGTSVGTLTVAGNVTLGGNMVMELNRSLSPNSDRLQVASGGYTITGGGTLTATNIGPVLQVGDTFQLFAAGVSGITATLQTLDRVNGVRYTWTDHLASSGSITVASVTPVPQPPLTYSLSGNTLTLSWADADFNKLQTQTNQLNVGLSTNWFNYLSGASSPVNISINRTNPTVFFRLSLQ